MLACHVCFKACFHDCRILLASHMYGDVPTCLLVGFLILFVVIVIVCIVTFLNGIISCLLFQIFQAFNMIIPVVYYLFLCCVVVELTKFYIE